MREAWMWEIKWGTDCKHSSNWQSYQRQFFVLVSIGLWDNWQSLEYKCKAWHCPTCSIIINYMKRKRRQRIKRKKMCGLVSVLHVFYSRFHAKCRHSLLIWWRRKMVAINGHLWKIACEFDFRVYSWQLRNTEEFL